MPSQSFTDGAGRAGVGPLIHWRISNDLAGWTIDAVEIQFPTADGDAEITFRTLAVPLQDQPAAVHESRTENRSVPREWGFDVHGWDRGTPQDYRVDQDLNASWGGDDADSWHEGRVTAHIVFARNGVELGEVAVQYRLGSGAAKGTMVPI